MPPTLTIARARSARAKSAWWNAGTSGAPCPPAAMSRRRKSATTVTPGALGHARRIVELQRPVLVRPVPDGLPVHADGRELRRREPRRPAGGEHRVRVAVGERDARARRALELVGAARLQRREFVAQRRREFDVRGAQRAADAGGRREVRDDGVDAVEARARHDPAVAIGAHGRGRGSGQSREATRAGATSRASASCCCSGWMCVTKADRGLGGQRPRRGQRHRQGIARLVVDAELVVQVRPRGPARGADEADHVALAHARALAQGRGEARQVRVQRRVGAAVPHDDHVAVAALRARLRRRRHRRSRAPACPSARRSPRPCARAAS